MGLDDLIPDKDKQSGSSGGISNKASSETSSAETISYSGSSKYLSGERWRDIIEIMENELEITYGELAEKSPNEQEEILQQADKLVSGMGTWTGTEFEIETRCIVCGHDCTDDGVIIEGYNVCRGHSAQEVRTAINRL